jgi:NAD+ synthase (glutamine-hydrolysing)
VKLALAQLNPTIGNLTGNAQQILVAAQRAAEQGVRLLLTPELSLCGYPPRDLLLSPGFVEKTVHTLTQLAQDLPPAIAVLVGTVDPNVQAPSLGGKPLFNSMALLEGGKIQQVFHKRLLPTYDVFDEDRYFEPGEQSNYFVLKLQTLPGSEQAELESTLKIGVTICEDLWNDEAFWGKRSYPINPIAELTEQGVDCIVNLSASPYSVGKQQLRESMLQHGALRSGCPLLYVNQVGGNDDLIFDGNSVAVNRQGEIVCRARCFEADLVTLTFDATLRDVQQGTVMPQPSSMAAELWSALVLGVRDYAHKCGFQDVVIGLSGGVDSSLVAAIATQALGADHVLGILMPSPYSSDHSIQDALTLAENLGIKTRQLPIGELMQAYDRNLADLFTGTTPDLTEENIQSRIRGNLLMAISNKFGHLLLSTGNKSEMAVGYCTLYGDMNGGLAAIADVPKTKIYAICEWLNSDLSRSGLEFEQISCSNLRAKVQDPQATIIPPHVITKAPSAELRPGQVDQDSLPPYDTLDGILHHLIHEHQSPAEIVASGYEAAIVQRVAQLVARTEFKRRQAPPVLKVTDRAFGTGWRMPIASQWAGYLS